MQKPRHLWFSHELKGQCPLVAPRWLQSLSQWLSYRLPALHRTRLVAVMETAACLVMIGFASWYLLSFMRVMSETSLMNDEMYSILFFSSRGPLQVLTDYHAANNHIFFNLINSLTPNAQSFEPFRARLWSFVSVGALLVLVVGEFARRGRLLVGALLFQFIAVNYELLDQDLQARGYGFVLFCATISSLALLRYVEERKNWQLATIAVLTFLATWTMPIAIFFLGPLMLLLALQIRTRRIFIAGFVTLLAIVVAYLPMLGQLLKETQAYGDLWGREYNSLEAVSVTLRMYLLQSSVLGISLGNLKILGLLAAVILAALVLWRHDPMGRGIRTIGACAALFFAACLILQTPPIRTTNFIVIPIALGVLLTISGVASALRLEGLRPLVYIGVAAFFSLHSLNQIQTFKFMPHENWLESARHIRRVYPEGMDIYAIQLSPFLQHYLGSGFHVVDKFDPQKFAQGEEIVFDGDFTAKERFVPAKFSPAAMEVRIPQRLGDFQEISGVPPLESYIDRVVTQDDTGKDMDTYAPAVLAGPTTGRPPFAFQTSTTVTVFLKPGVIYRSLCILAQGVGLLRNASMRVTQSDGTQTLEPEQFIYGDLMTLELADVRVARIDFTIPVAKTDKHLSIDDIWAYPSRVSQ